MQHTIYGLYDPRTHPPCIRYVGYTGKGVAHRLAGHIGEAKRGKQTRRHKWIRSLLSAGVKPAFQTLEVVTAETWQERERHWIARLKGHLINATDGGEGLINPTDEVRAGIGQKVSALLVGNSRRKDVPHTEESKASISAGLLASEKAKVHWESMKGKPPSANSIAASVKCQTGAKRSQETKDLLSKAAIGHQRVLGYRWFNNGSEECLFAPEQKVPAEFVRGRLPGATLRGSVANAKNAANRNQLYQ